MHLHVEAVCICSAQVGAQASVPHHSVRQKGGAEIWGESPEADGAVILTGQGARWGQPVPALLLTACAAGAGVAAWQAGGQVQVCPKPTQVALFGPPVPGKDELQQLLAPVTGLVGGCFGVPSSLPQASKAAALAGRAISRVAGDAYIYGARAALHDNEMNAAGMK